MKKSTRVLSLILAMMMLFSAFSILASAKSVEVAETGVTMTGGEVLYLKPNSNWTQASARFAVYFFNNSTGKNTWVSMEKCPRDSGYYKVTVPAGTWANLIFCRMNPSSSTNDWSSKWNQSGDLTFDGTKNLFTVKSGAWDGATTTWSAWSETPEPTEPPTEEGETLAPTEPPTEAPTVVKTVYAIDSAKWGTVSAHAWDINDTTITTAWPGLAMTKTADTVNGFDVYEVTFDVDYNSVIFNNNNAGKQTEDLTLEEGKYYDIKSGVWYASLADVPVVDPLSTDRYILGDFNAWNALSHEFKLDAEGSSTGYVSLDLEANTTYEFKIIREGTWTSNSTHITGDKSGLTFSSSTSANAKITTKAAGTYVFSFGMTNSQLSVTYPVEVTEAPTEPEPTEPEATEPEATEPEVEPTEPEVEPTEPEVEPTEPEVEPTEAPAPEYITVYFQNNWLWKNIHAYTWNADGEYEVAWPGAAMDFHANDGTYDIYKIEIPAGNKLIISGTKNDGTGATDQTPDITDAVDGRCYYMTWADGNQVGFEDIDVMIPPVEPTEPEVEPTEPEATPDQPIVDPTEPETEAPTVPNPTKVDGLTVVAVTETSIDVAWNAIDGVQKYWVMIDGVVRYVTTDTAITLKADSNTTYEIAVIAKLADDTLLTYEEAEKVEATTKATVTDEFTYTAEATADRTSVTINWTAENATKTWVYFGTTEDSLKIKGVTTGNTLTVDGLEANTTYYYKLSFLVDGKVVDSEVAEIKTEQPTVKLDVDVVNRSVKVDWDDCENATKYWITTEANGKQLTYSTYESEYTIPHLVFDYEIKALVDGKVVTIY